MGGESSFSPPSRKSVGWRIRFLAPLPQIRRVANQVFRPPLRNRVGGESRHSPPTQGGELSFAPLFPAGRGANLFRRPPHFFGVGGEFFSSPSTFFRGGWRIWFRRPPLFPGLGGEFFSSPPTFFRLGWRIFFRRPPLGWRHQNPCLALNVAVAGLRQPMRIRQIF